MADKVPIQIRESDLVGDCVRLNRRFNLDEERISALENPATSVDPLLNAATTFLTVSTSYAQVPGMQVTLTHPGWWKIDVTARCLLAALDTAWALTITVTADGTKLPGVILNEISLSSSNWVVVSKSWLYNSVKGNEQISVSAKKTGGTGNSQVEGNTSSASQTSQIMAVWVGPYKRQVVA